MVVSASMSAVTKKIGVRVRDHDFSDVHVRVRGQGRTRLSADTGVRVHRSLIDTKSTKISS